MQRDGDPDTASRSLVEQGEQCLEAGDCEGALERANAAVAASPRYVAAVSLRAAALDALDGVDEARAAHEDALRLAPRDVDAIAEAAEFHLRRGTENGDQRWLERAQKLAEVGAGLTGPTRPDEMIDFVLLESDALMELGAPRSALARIDEALRAVPEELLLQVERGLLLFETCQFDEARTQLETALRADPSNPSAHHTLGLIAERSGDTREAAARFARAHASAADEFPVVVRLSTGEFDRAVEDALEELPSQIRDYLANVAITVEDFPADADLLGSEPPLSPTILGVFRGSPIGDKASMDPWSHFPSSIVLYQRNLERFAENRDDLVDQIRVTLVHEVGHFVGLDEDQLRKLGVG